MHRMKLPLQILRMTITGASPVHCVARRTLSLFSSDDIISSKQIRQEQSIYNSFAAIYKHKTASALKKMTETLRRIGEKDNLEPMGDVSGEYEYYFDSSPSQACDDLRRRKISSNQNEDEIVIDINNLARYYQAPIAVHQVRPFSNGAYVTASIEDTSTGHMRLLCKNIASNIVYDLTLPVAMVDYDIADCGTNLAVILLSTEDGLRPSQVHTSHLPLTLISETPHTPHGQVVKSLVLPSPRLVCEEEDPQFFMDINRSKDERFLFIHSQSKVASSVSVLDTTRNCELLHLVKSYNTKYFVTSDSHNFFATTNHFSESGDMEVLCQPISAAADSRKWIPYWPIASLPRSFIFDMEVMHDYVVILSRFCVELFVDIMRSSDGSLVKRISSSDIEKIAGVRPLGFHVMGNNNITADTVRIQLSSPILKDAFIDVCCRTGVIIKQANTFTSSTSQKLVITNTSVPSHDNYAVPITLLRRDEVKLPSPVLMIGYGSYGVSVPMEYDHLLSYLLHDGWTIAYAHIRGGGELGVKHHTNGMKNKKWNTFHDYIACADYLHNKGVAMPHGLCALGHSAGGLAIGVAANLRPELFSAVLMRAPFINIYDTMQDIDDPLTQHEYDEWGNVNDPEALKYIKSYCPFHNLRKQKYPAIHVSIGLRDDKVAPEQTFRYAKQVRNAVKENCVLLSVHETGDHHGSGTQMGQVEEAAKEAGFLDYIVHSTINK